MASLEDLKQSITDMSEEDLYALLTEIRLSRRVKKASAKTSSSSSNRAAKAAEKLSLEALLGAMNPEQMAELLSKLGGKT